MHRNHNHHNYNNNSSSKMSDRRTKTNDRQQQNGDQNDKENRHFFVMYKNRYLECESADVHFVCGKPDGEGESERVPAHKLLLSACDGFKKLFDADTANDQNEIQMVDTPVAAMKEFLQFFYFPKVKLTFENIADVMKLAQEYGHEEFLICCSTFLEPRLTTENIIWGYSLAIRFNRDKMKNFCEKKISANAAEVVKSNTFSNCDRDVLNHVLQLDSLHCEESRLLAGCLSWAKAVADRKGLDSKDTQVLREELGDLLYQIRFKSMAIDSFTMIVGSYAGFFSGSELEEIIQMIVSKDYRSEKFNSTFRVNTGASNRTNSGDKYKNDQVIDMNRFAATSQVRHNISKVETTRFELNKAVYFVGFDIGKVFSLNSDKKKIIVPVKYLVTEDTTGPQKNKLFEGTTAITSDEDTHVSVCCPILMVPNKKYEIVIEQQAFEEIFNQTELKTNIEAKHGYKIRFLPDPSKVYEVEDPKYGLVHRLQFKRA